jgi:predicted ATPase with chaperone activity
VATQARAMAAVSASPGRTPRAVASSPPPQAPKKAEDVAFFPLEARNGDEVGIDSGPLLNLVLRTMLGAGGVTGRSLAEATALPIGVVRDLLDEAKNHKLVNYRSTTALGDYVTELTDSGIEKAMQSRKFTSYVGTAPVPYDFYLQALKIQALADKNPGVEDLQRAFSDIFVSEEMLERLGPAVSSGRAMFLFGEPGNGKTSLAERMTRCFGDTVWIPMTLDIGGHLVKLYDPAIHVRVDIDPDLHKGRYDRRWIRIKRPTVIAGGELTLDMLEIKVDDESKVCEASLQMKANLGTFVIDDFGRGNTSPRDLLNRWIFPLEKRIDFQQLPDGRKIQVPFDALLVFSTNLEPRDLADEAFLRRIPYKIYVGDPLEDEFTDLVKVMARKMGVQVEDRTIRYVVDKHYKQAKRPMRMCHPRDLLMQIQHLCEYERRPSIGGPTEWDRVVNNYFGY